VGISFPEQRSGIHPYGYGAGTKIKKSCNLEHDQEELEYFETLTRFAPQSNPTFVALF